MDRDDPPTMRRRAAVGGAWAYAALVVNRLGTLVAFAVLARVLSPEEFGLAALALAFMAFLNSVRDFGVTQAIVILKDDDEADIADAAWRLSVGIGLGLGVLLALASPVIADFFDRSDLGPIVAVLGLVFVVRAPTQAHFALAQKHMDFRSRTAAEVTDVCARSVVSIGLALAGAGAMSLIVGYIVGAAGRSLVLWRLVTWRPRRRAPGLRYRSILRQGMTLTAVDVNAAVIQNVDYAFVGKVLGPAQLGIYTLAFRIPEVVVKQFSAIAGEVLFPAFAATDPRRLGAVFLESMRLTLLLAVPAAATLMLLAEPLIVVVFGEQWRSGADAMVVLSLYALTSTISVPAGTVYRATGRASVILRLTVPRSVLLVISLVLFTDDGIVAVALAQAGGSALLALSNIALAGRLLSTGARAILGTILPALGATLLMAGPILLARPLAGDVAAALAGPVLAAGLYLAALRIVAPGELRRVLGILSLLRRRRAED